LKVKKKSLELEVITKESENDEKKLGKSRSTAAKAVENRLLVSFDKIRNNMRNGLAVVTVKRGACGGCFNIVPPQKQAEIRERKKVIVCEHCGRILADVEDEIAEEIKPKRRTKRATAAISVKKEPAPKKTSAKKATTAKKTTATKKAVAAKKE